MADSSLGFQGGDTRHLPHCQYLDLSSCVNRYGPADSVIDKLRTIKFETVQLHPYEASEKLSSAYAEYLSVPKQEILAGRGTTEFIWSLARIVNHEKTIVPLPAYTDFLRAFPNRGRQFKDFTCAASSIENLSECMRDADWVIISNPNNPTGTCFSRSELLGLCKSYPAVTLVVDESYVDFLVDEKQVSLIGSDLDNVIVLRSPSKFFGIAGVRTGIAWTKNIELQKQLKERQDTWPLSGLDVLVAIQALTDRDWIYKTRKILQDDSLWLEASLKRIFEKVISPVPIHYRFVFSESANLMVANLQENNVLVRLLGEAHGIAPGGFRISAPLSKERTQLTKALSSISLMKHVG